MTTARPFRSAAPGRRGPGQEADRGSTPRRKASRPSDPGGPARRRDPARAAGCRRAGAVGGLAAARRRERLLLPRVRVRVLLPALAERTERMETGAREA